MLQAIMSLTFKQVKKPGGMAWQVSFHINTIYEKSEKFKPGKVAFT